jgi:cytochrome c biogenesis protein CcmG/thiol:disulfide interchange protein DsbE
MSTRIERSGPEPLAVARSTDSGRRGVLRPLIKRGLLAGAVTAVLGATQLGCAASAPRAQTAQPNSQAPDFVASDLQGRAVRLSSLRGQVVVLFLWAAWDCADELPPLDRMAARLAGRGVSVLAVSIDRDREVVQRVAGTRAWQLSLLHDRTARVAEAYHPRGFPVAYVIDRAGVIRHVVAGARAAELASVEVQARQLSTGGRHE